MKKIIKLKMIIFLLSFCFFNTAYSEVVKKINITGNERIPEKTITVFGDIELNKNYQSDDINQIIKKLFDTRFFSDIKVELVGGVLNINVKENPLINLIIFKGIKADKYKKPITELLELREKTPFVKNKVKKDIDQIKNFYRHGGYYFVKIDAEVQNLENNRVNIIYSVDQGDKAKIAKIFFLGDKKIRDTRLRGIITSQESKFWKVLSKNIYLNENRVELDTRLLKNYYKNKGYYEAQVTSSNVEYIEDKGFVLTFSIDAGKRYRFGKVSANISEALKKTEFFALDGEFKKLVGEYYSKRALAKILNKIDELSAIKELQFIDHRIKETLDGDKVVVEILIDEGPKLFVERINIVGNNVTNEAVIRGEMVVDEGDPFSNLLLNRSVNNLKARNIFADVRHVILPGSTPDTNIIEIEVEEKPTGEIAAGAGVGTEGTSFNFFVKENNFIGRGIQLSASLDLSEESVRGGIDVTNPNYNYTGNAVSASLRSTKTDRLDKSGYESTKTSASLGTSFEQYRDIFISPSIAASYEDVSTDSSASSSLQKMKGTYSAIDFGYGISYDKRNQKFQTTDGFITQFSQSLPLYADTPSIMNTITFSKYRSFTEDVIGSVKFLGQNITTIDADEDVRISDRIYLPTRRIRGFQKGKIGPKDGDDHVGGNYALALGFEAALPNLLPEDWRTDVVVFFDSANLWGVDYDESIGSSDKIRSSTGLSASVFTPIGPLSLTLAHPITKAASDQTESFTFRLGTSF